MARNRPTEAKVFTISVTELLVWRRPPRRAGPGHRQSFPTGLPAAHLIGLADPSTHPPGDMTRVIVGLLGVAAALTIPTADSLATNCTGSGAVPTSKKIPACYNGTKSVLGGAFKESVLLTIEKFDFKTPNASGVMSVHAIGVSPEQCNHIPFSKVGPKLDFDFKGCLGPLTIKATYCSDQDKLQLDVQIPHFPIADLIVDMLSLPCPAWALAVADEA